jgi:hypothetical protein
MSGRMAIRRMRHFEEGQAGLPLRDGRLLRTYVWTAAFCRMPLRGGVSEVVGATGVEPARIAPKDPKSFASANSATRPEFG